MKFSKVISFLTFSGIAEISYIEKIFDRSYTESKSKVSYWSPISTRKKILSDFWYTEVMLHFTSIMILACSITFCTGASGSGRREILPTLPLVSLIAFLIMTAGIYLPLYNYVFVPVLDSVIENHSSKKIPLVHKCKQQQLSLKAIVIIQSVLQRMAAISDQPFNTQYLQILSEQYGVSKQGLSIAFQEIFIRKIDIRKERLATEISNSFLEAERYFKMLGSDEGVQQVVRLESKFFQKS